MNPGWLLGIPRSWIILTLNILSSIIPGLIINQQGFSGHCSSGRWGVGLNPGEVLHQSLHTCSTIDVSMYVSMHLCIYVSQQRYFECLSQTHLQTLAMGLNYEK